jgi:hypothetical protein
MIVLLALILGKSQGTVKIERPLHNLRCLVLRLYPAATYHTPPASRLRLLLVGVSFSFSFQFFTRLAAVFAEEVGGLGFFAIDGRV